MPAPAQAAAGLGEFMRDTRLAAGLTTAQIAAAVGVHQTTVSGWELGKGWSTLPQYMTRLAMALGTDPELLRRYWWDDMGG